MRIAALVFGGVALACSAQGATRSQLAAPTEPAAIERSADDAEPPTDPVAELEVILLRTELEDPGFRHGDVARALQRAGLTESLAIRAMSTCFDGRRKERCLDAQQADDVATWLAEHGSTRAAAILYARKELGSFTAGRALESILVRRMIADAGPCAAPSAQEIEHARAELAGFVVVDAAPAGLVARVPTGRELDDLAYFMAAVADAGEEVGPMRAPFRSGRVPQEKELAQRAGWLAEIEKARRAADLPTAQARGFSYIVSLGYPGEIDHSREGEMTWGGARASHLMRDVALTSEILGELDVADALYSRANPGGGGCGTTTGYRWAQQVEGVIRTRERTQGCRAVVAERLLDVDGDWTDESPYGPARLVEAGFDLARLYRGALVTRNRELEPATVLAAIERAPAAIRVAAIARWENEGPEAWEWRVRAIEGIADEFDRAGVELLLAQHESFASSARVRALSAIGAASSRPSIGPCEDDTIWIGGFGIGGPWERPVRMFATTCATRISDRDAGAMTKRLRPQLETADLEIRAAAIHAIGEIAAPGARRLLRRQLATAKAELQRCKTATPDDCWDFENVRGTAESAIENIDRVVAGD
jgi:hypothetical protein